MSMKSAPRLAKRRHAQKGSAAIEFAFIAPVFIALILSICEVGWVNFSDAVIERANSEASRQLRTGQIQNIDITNDAEAQQRAVFETICDLARFFGNCADTVTVEVVTFPSFQTLAADQSPIVCRDSAQDAQDNLQFNPGGESAIVRIRTCVLFNTFNPVVGLSLARSNGQPNRLISQFLFRTEPFRT